jgi:hypothetical protein
MVVSGLSSRNEWKRWKLCRTEHVYEGLFQCT